MTMGLPAFTPGGLDDPETNVHAAQFAAERAHALIVTCRERESAARAVGDEITAAQQAAEAAAQERLRDGHRRRAELLAKEGKTT